MKNMYKLKLKNILTLLVAIITLVSCNNNEIDLENETKILSIDDYFKVINTKALGGKILLQSTTTEFSQDKYNAAMISSSFDTNLKTRKEYVIQNNSTKTFVIFNEDSHGNKELTKQLYGNNISYSFGNELQEKAGGGNENNIYIPELLNIQIDSNELQVGTTITWNVDALNTNGLILWYQYTPLEQSNYDIVDQNRKSLVGGFTIPDEIGSYVITANDISGLPDNAFISFYVTRAGFDFRQNSTNDQIAFIGVTTVSKDLKVTK